VDVRMIRKGLAPGMQNRHGPCVCTQKLRVSSGILQGLTCCIEKQFVKHTLVDIKQWVQQVGNRKYYVKIPAGNKPFNVG